MKALFVHDNRFYQDRNGDVFSGGAFPPTIWKNYFLNFDNVLFYGRSAKSQDGMSKTATNSEHLSFHLIKDYKSASGFIKQVPKIKKELKKNLKDSDILIARLPSFLGYLAVIEANRQKKPIWVEQVGNCKDSLLNHGSIIGKIIGFPVDIINKILIKKASFVSYVTNEQLQRAYPSSTDAIEIALSDVVVNNILNEKDIDKSRYFGNILNLGLIGNLDLPYKGQSILLEAVSKLPEEVSSNIRLNFIGGGSSKPIHSKAKKLRLSRNINFIGPLASGEEINNFLSKMSLYVQCSLQEGLPRATVEAMAMGCPVIGSNAGGLPELLNENLIHNKGDSDKLAEDILMLYNNRILLYKEALRSLRKAEEYKDDVLQEKRISFYRKMNERLLS